MNPFGDSAKRYATPKYEALAGDYSSRYADPAAIASRQVALLAKWGTPILPGASVLELGCADGFVTAELARAGYEVTGFDISAKMIEVARHRLETAGLRAQFRVANIEALDHMERYDAVLGFMWTFFFYVGRQQEVLRQLASCTRSKILLDLNPRITDLGSAAALVRRAGFGSVKWRPMFTPQQVKVGPAVHTALRGLERVPGVRSAILKKKFVVVIKGEKD